MRAAAQGVLAAVVPVVLLLALAAGLTWHFSARLADSRALVLHTVEVIDAAQSLLALAQEAETGQRGFIITQRRSYLEPYRAATAAITTRVASLAEMVTDNPQQLGRVREIESLLDGKLAEMRRTVELSEAGNADAARAMILSDQGKIAMDSIKRVIGEFVAVERTLLAARIVEANESQRSTLLLAMVGTVLALAAIAAGTVVLLRRNRDLRRAEEVMSEQKVLLQSTLDNCRDGIAAFDGSGGLAAFNRHFFDLLDFPAETARAGHPYTAFQELERTRSCRALADPVGGADGDDAFVLAKVGARDLEVYRKPMPGGGFVVTALDITRRLQTEAIIRQAQKMEAVGRLTGGIAHDFNNLLQVIGSNLDLLARDFPSDGEAARRLRNAGAGVERGGRLTAQLLAFARKLPLDPHVLNLARLVRETSELLRRSLGELIEVEASVAGGLWNTLADPSQIENAILNLAINARDAMPGGGKLTIEVANAFLDDAYAARHAEVTAGQYVMLAVSDTGTGMAPEIMSQVFEPFFSTKPEGEGTGLGLSQVYGFVKQSGGHIKLYSELGHGTTVKIYLPRSHDAEDRAEAPLAAPGRGEGETVLLVEDDAAVRLAAGELLQDLGYRVLPAADAEAALAILSEGIPVDLLFTDVVMPGPITSRELARRARKLLPHIAVLFTSGYTENAIIHDGRLDRDTLLLSKPYRGDELARRVRLALSSAKRREPDFVSSEPAPATVLLVEDDALIRLSIAEMVRQLGYAVIEAATAYEALDQLKSQATIGVMVTDVGLPGMRGPELATAARKLRPDLVIVLATGYALDPLDLATGLRGDINIIRKPFGPDDLRRVLP